MSKKNRLAKLIVAVSAFFLLIFSLECHAGTWLTQVYLGDLFTQNHNVSVALPQAGLSGTHEDLHYDTAPLFGIRESYWFLPYFGVGFEGAYALGPDQAKQVSETNLCVLGLGCRRAPELIQPFINRLTSFGPVLVLSYPVDVMGHEIQPYVGLGPTVFIFSSSDTYNFIPMAQTSVAESTGLQTYVGIHLFLNAKMGAFIEYRYNSFSLGTHFYNERIVNGLRLGSTLGRERFVTQAMVFGLSYRF